MTRHSHWNDLTFLFCLVAKITYWLHLMLRLLRDTQHRYLMQVTDLSTFLRVLLPIRAQMLNVWADIQPRSTSAVKAAYSSHLHSPPLHRSLVREDYRNNDTKPRDYLRPPIRQAECMIGGDLSAGERLASVARIKRVHRLLSLYPLPPQPADIPTTS